ncbi:MAG: glycerol-3-phosphate 1-O-acyltransferase PlsY [Clostridia bacterium]|nr:glycerol-3-phosphate 1-O-acyltransferase PlsY [Clostridia bacterium]
MFNIGFIIFAILGYLLGSLNFSIIIGKLFYKIDVREHGSKNAGTTNTLRVLGKGPAIFVLLFDTFKAVIAYWVVLGITKNASISYVAAAAAVVGHNFPVFFGFKGGKGVATSLGACFCLNPLLGLFVLIIGVSTIALTRYVSVGSLAGSTSSIILFLFFDPNPLKLVLLVILTASMYIRHKENLKRLANHSENKISFSKKSTEK